MPGLLASSLGCLGGRAEKGRRACNYVSGIWIPTPVSLWLPRRLSCQFSANHREAETSTKVNKHWKTHAKGNDVITNVISTNQHFASTFSKQIFKFKRCSCKLYDLLPSFSLPTARVPQRACLQAIKCHIIYNLAAVMKKIIHLYRFFQVQPWLDRH